MGRLQNLAHLLGRKRHHAGFEALILRLAQMNRNALRSAFRLTINGLEQFIVAEILRVQMKVPSGSVFPSGRSQIAHRGLALAIVELGDLAKLQAITLAGAAGKIVYDPAANTLK